MQNESVQHFKNLLKINTANPPGNEWPAIMYLKEQLEKEGLKVFVQETAPNRGNLVVRIKGSGEKKPLLISSHVDVVNAETEHWSHDPFSATESDGCIYGRGSIDMKDFTAQCLMAILTAHREKWPLKRDLIMSAVSDEEAGGVYGMKRLVDEHPDLVTAEYALGEVGAYTTYVNGQPVYPIQAGEKGVFWIDVTFKGEPGHGSVPNAQNVHWKLAEFLTTLKTRAMPFHSTRTFTAFVDGLKASQGVLKGIPLSALNTPLGPTILKKLSMKTGSQKTAGLLAMMTNTVNPTGLQSGRQHNVVPSQVTLKLDCRVIPGVSPETVVSEIENLTGTKLDYKLVNSKPGHESPIDTPLFALMKRKLEESHPGATALPWLTVGYTDAGYLQKLGNICYGYTPVKLTPDLDFTKLYHGHNERVPVEGFLWGTRVFLETVKDFCC